MFCEKCGARIEDDAKFCIACGAKIENDAQPVQEQSVEAAQEPEVIVEPVVAEPVAVAQPVVEQPASFEQVPVSVAEEPVIAEQPTPVKKKKKKWPIVLAIILAFIAALVGVFFAFKDFIIFNVMKLMPAESQFKYVYSETTTDLTKNVTNALASFRNGFGKEQTVEGDVTIKLNSSLVTILNQAAGGVDLSDVSEAKVNYKVTQNNGLTKCKFGIGNSKAIIINAEMCIDSENQVATLRVPELSEATVKLDLAELYEMNMGGSKVESMPEVGYGNASLYATGYSATQSYVDQSSVASLLAELLMSADDLMPSEELVEKLIPKYVEIIFNQITEIERTSEEITASGVTQKVTKFTANIDEHVVKDMLIAVLDAVKEDEDIEAYFVTVFDEVKSKLPVDGNADEYWEKLCDAIDETAKQIRDAEFESIDISYVTYVNSRGEIVGIECQAWTGGQEVVDISMLTLENGKDVGIYEVVEISKSKIFEVEGNGVKSKDKFTGKIELEIMGMKFIEVNFTDFDTEGYKEGRPNGTYEIKISNLGMFIPDLSRFGSETNASIEFVFNSTKDTTETEMSLRAIGINLGTIKFTNTVSEAEDISMPSDTVDDIELWARSFKPDKLEENMKEAGVYSFLEKIYGANTDVNPNVSQIQPR